MFAVLSDGSAPCLSTESGELQMGQALASWGFGESIAMSWRYFVFIGMFFDSLKKQRSDEPTLA